MNQNIFLYRQKVSWLIIIISLIFLILLIPGCGGGGGGSDSVNHPPGISLSWEAPTTRANGTPLEDQDIGGYKIYYAQSYGIDNFIGVMDVGKVTTYSLKSFPPDTLLPGTYYFAVTAYDISGNESDYSNIVSKTIN